MSSSSAERSGPLRAILARVARIAAFLLLLDASLFFLFDLLPDAAVIRSGSMALDPNTLALARERMGLSGAPHERYLQHWANLARFDLGKSLVGGFAIGPMVWNRMLGSLPLWIGSVSLLLLLPIPVASRFATPGALKGRCRVELSVAKLLIVPQFVASAICFALWALMLADSGLAVTSKWAMAIVSCAALPLGVLYLAAAQSYHETRQARFCDLYAAIGMSNRAIRWRLTRNVIIAVRPLVARLVLSVLLGSVFAELMFDIKGYGYLFVESIRSSDLNVMRIWVLLTGVLVLSLTELERRA